MSGKVFQSMRKLTDNQWEVLMHWLLTLVGGFMGTYAVLLHAGNFGSAQTGNIMEMAAELVSMEWSKVILRLIAFVIFGGGVVAAYLLANYTKLNMRKLALWVDAAGLALASFLPLEPALVGLYPIFFCASFQWGVYSAAGGFNSASIFTTNNYKQALLGWTQYILTKDREFLRKATVYTFTVFSFFIGACLGAWSVYTLNVRGAYVAFIPLAIGRGLIAVGERPAEDETPVELAAQATEEAEEAVLLEEELPPERHHLKRR